MFLVFLKDLYWFIDLEQDNYGEGSVAFLQELLFVGSVILAEMINLIVSFCRNLKQFFHNQNTSMEAVSKGNLNQHVMISSQDEFSVMGRYTNWMIEMLKKRNRELEKARREIVVRLGRAAEYRDNETGMHVIRMSYYSAALAKAANHPSPSLRKRGVKKLFLSVGLLFTLPAAGAPIFHRPCAEQWSQRAELNRRPTDYESVALPLSYAGLKVFSGWKRGTLHALPGKNQPPLGVGPVTGEPPA